MPLHALLSRESSSIEDALIMIEKHPAALEHQGSTGLLIRFECSNQCRLAVISKCIQLHPKSLAVSCDQGCLPLHNIVSNHTSSFDVALLLIEKYPVALRHQNLKGQLPLHIECMIQCRIVLVRKYLALYPQ
jgi:hypothetical protein